MYKHCWVSILMVLSFNVCLAQEPKVNPFRKAVTDSLRFLNENSASDGLNINFFDKAKLQSEYLGILQKRNERDYQFLYTSLGSLHEGFYSIQAVFMQLKELADDALTTAVELNRFLAITRSYSQESAVIKDKINSLALLPSLQTDEMVKSVSKMDFSLLKDHYHGELKKIDLQVSLIHFRITLPNGSFHEQMGVDCSTLRSMQLYTSQQIAEMKRKVLLLKAMPARERNVLDQSVNAFTKQTLETYVSTFGTSERYRTSSDLDGRKRAAIALQDVFWARSYIRATYGIKIGSIPVNYAKQIFNVDYYLSDITIGGMPIYEENTLIYAVNIAKEALVTLEGAVSDHWQSNAPGSIQTWGAVSDRWQGNTLRSIQTWITGRTHEIDAKHFVIKRVNRDLEEELMLGKPGGLKQVRDRYRKAFHGNENDTKHYREKVKQFFSAHDDSEDDVEADVDLVEAGTLKGSIAQCISALEMQESRIFEASQLQSTVDALTKDNPVITRRLKRQEL